MRVRCRLPDSGQSFNIWGVSPDHGQFVCNFGDRGIDLTNGQAIALDYYDLNGNRVIHRFYTPYPRANTTWDAVDGWFGAGVTVWFTVTDSLGNFKGGGSGTARPDGWLNGFWCGDHSSTGDCDMLPGDRVTVTSDAGFFAVLEPITITGWIDIEKDQISGDMEGGDFPADGEYWLWSRYRQEGYGDFFTIEDDGSYLIELAAYFDVLRGDDSEVWYIDPNGNRVGIQLSTLRLRVNYTNDWLEIQTTPDASVAITVANKATQEGTADRSGWYASHQQDGDWDPSRPDIQAGDAVTVTAGGYQAWVNPVGAIDGVIDLAENKVVGTLTAPFDEPLMVWCEVWVRDGPDAIQLDERRSAWW